MNIQWYPGHMTKTKRMMEENLKLVDIVIELLDARLPYSSKNPDMDILAKNKYRIILLNKSDLADDLLSAKWEKFYVEKGFKVILTDCVSGKGLNSIVTVCRELMKDKMEAQLAKGRINFPIRAMIVGIPNVGKSTFINKFVGKAAAKTGDKPGITRGRQWIKIKKDFDLLDTPGILWPKFEDEIVGLNLAFTGAVNDEIIDRHSLAVKLLERLDKVKPVAVMQRYKIQYDADVSPQDILQMIGKARGFIMKGGEIDSERSAVILLDEFRGGKLGRITLENPYA